MITYYLQRSQQMSKYQQQIGKRAYNSDFINYKEFFLITVLHLVYQLKNKDNDFKCKHVIRREIVLEASVQNMIKFLVCQFPLSVKQISKLNIQKYNYSNEAIRKILKKGSNEFYNENY